MMIKLLLCIALCVVVSRAALNDGTSYATGSCFCVESHRSNVNIRNSPSLSASKAGQAQGEECFWYLGGKQTANGYTWYSINFKFDGQAAWAAGNFFNKVASSRCSDIDCGTDNTKLSDSTARNMLNNKGIPTVSSGSCTNRHKSTCTSLDQVRCQNIRDLIWLKERSGGCYIKVTGGTEIGHATSTYSHWNGYKLDISKSNSCINNFVTAFGISSYSPFKTYYDPKKNRYYDESNHWDIAFRKHF